ncbi:MAG TPA: FlgD immunoglobulin-like domain containing protein [Bacteroidia bacterium]|jgi:hypothetical protein|nr:FlgD immunoglobulin-like domain containing protein [Bacteroidia bacterium]
MIKKILLVCFAFILFEGKAQVYYENIAQIYINRCTSCHNQYGHANMIGYTNAVANAPNTLAYLQTGYMPPWPPDTTYTRFTHERLITTAEKNSIINWINGGKLYVDTTLAPAFPTYSKYKLLGTPSLVLQIPVFASNASNADKYNCFALPSGLAQDEVLRAFEIVPGNPTIVHHVVVNVDTTGSIASDLSGNCFTEPGQFSIGGYAPGGEPLIFPGVSPLKLGMRIKAGSKIILQIHYPKGTVGQIDSTQIRLYFYPHGTTGIRPLYAKTLLQNWNLYIPANTSQTFTAQYPSGSGTIASPLSIYSSFPHSHSICTSLINWADNGSTTIPLIKENKWDFNWQGYYTYHNMVKIPSGYKIRSSHFYDNTTNNPHNPNPVLVVAGTSTSDEMLFDAFMYTNYKSGDENINIDSLLMNDTLLVANVQSYAKNNTTKISAYPNPFSDKINIVYELTRPAFVTVSVFNIFGQEVTKLFNGYQGAGSVRYEWDGRNNGTALAPGMYTYKIMIDNAAYSGKMILKSKN